MLTYLSCFEKSSFCSSSSQLSSHKCRLPLGSSVSSSAQSRETSVSVQVAMQKICSTNLQLGSPRTRRLLLTRRSASSAPSQASHLTLASLERLLMTSYLDCMYKLGFLCTECVECLCRFIALRKSPRRRHAKVADIMQRHTQIR